MTDYENLVLIGGLIVAAIGAFRWYHRAAGITPLACTTAARLPLWVIPPLCVALLWLVLSRYADDEVRPSFGYRLLFVAAWGVAMIGVNTAAHLIGVEGLGHGIERRNPAAVWASAGAWVGATLVVAGSNVGEGPTINTTLGPMLLALAAFVGLWAAFAAASRNAESVAVGRDRASGLRLAGLLVAWGLILGRAIAGDWDSAAGTVRDLVALGWPAAALLLVATALELPARPSRFHPTPPAMLAGAVPGLLYIVAALAWVASLGGWDGRPWAATLAGPG